MDFYSMIEAAATQADSLVCVGLDPDMDRLPAPLKGRPDALRRFLAAIIDATADTVCAYKPNSAFFEAMGAEGIEVLRSLRDMIPAHIPLIFDVKRGDIGSTAERYAVFAYDMVGADAVTVNPYMGFDAVRPFMREGKCAFVLCLTSNSSAAEFQLLDSGGRPLFEHVASTAAAWSREGGIGLVAGATRPEHLARIRGLAGELPILVPGVGAQGGDIGAVIGGCGGIYGKTVINSSRQILYASSGEDFAEAARAASESLRSAIAAAGKGAS